MPYIEQQPGDDAYQIVTSYAGLYEPSSGGNGGTLKPEVRKWLWRNIRQPWRWNDGLVNLTFSFSCDRDAALFRLCWLG